MRGPLRQANLPGPPGRTLRLGEIGEKLVSVQRNWCQFILKYELTPIFVTPIFARDDMESVPPDGTPYWGPGEDRRLRGGCHHNWDIHCTVWWRYGIDPDAHDGCIGCRLALAGAQAGRRNPDGC